MGLDLSKTATKLLAKLASTTHVKLKRLTGAVVDPVLGTTTGGTIELFDLTAAVTSVPDNLIDETRVQAGDRIVICDNQIQPILSDLIVIPDDAGNDEEFRILEIAGANHAGVRQVYRLLCRG